jgi:metallo-beta-lactamase family protein
MKLSFLGAAGEVTGSCYLVETATVRFIVDCGMFQGGRDADEKNNADFAFDPRSLDFVLLTHAHIDHSGLLPRLCAQGFRGAVHTTAATIDLLEVMLLDSAHIQEKELEWRQRTRPSRRRDKSKRDVPLYTVAQAQASLAQMHSVPYDAEFKPKAGVRCRLRDAGHILGAAIIEVWIMEGDRETKIVFSGDIGHAGKPIVRDTTPIDEADILLIESTYGNRLHKSLADTMVELEGALNETLGRKQGNVIVPAFAVGRTQDLLYLLCDLYRQDRLPPLNIYVDSPMALKATEITIKHAELLDAETRAMFNWLRTNRERPQINFIHDVEESIALAEIKNGAVIISASGMCNAGRIKRHLADNLGRDECAVVFTGFQAHGTLGRRIVDGEKSVRIFGEEVPVRASIYTIGGLSAHADQAELLSWLRNFRRPPRHTYVVHGEVEAAEIFRGVIGRELGWNTSLPLAHSTVEI